jgi:hypothetical protein
MKVSLQSLVVPELDHDAKMLQAYDRKVSPTGRLERRIVAALCAHLAEYGWAPCAVFDGEDLTPVSSVKEAMELVFNLDQSHLYFRQGVHRKHHVFLVNGNGVDMVSDYSYAAFKGDNFEEAMEAFDPEVLA